MVLIVPNLAWSPSLTEKQEVILLGSLKYRDELTWDWSAPTTYVFDLFGWWSLLICKFQTNLISINSAYDWLQIDGHEQLPKAGHFSLIYNILLEDCLFFFLKFSVEGLKGKVASKKNLSREYKMEKDSTGAPKNHFKTTRTQQQKDVQFTLLLLPCPSFKKSLITAGCGGLRL